MHDDASRNLLTGSRPVPLVSNDRPVIDYVHESELGRLTVEAEELLVEHDVADLYDESLPGDVFPTHR